MSYIRAGGEPHWFENANAGGMYVYSDRERMNGVPDTEPEFAELAMRILRQSGELDVEELATVRDAFAERLDFDDNWEMTLPPMCSIDGCISHPHQKGLCAKHYCEEYGCE